MSQTAEKQKQFLRYFRFLWRRNVRGQNERKFIFWRKYFVFKLELMIAKQLIEAILTISSLKMAYLTLNPSNVMVDANNKVVLKNFGLAEEF